MVLKLKVMVDKETEAELFIDVNDTQIIAARIKNIIAHCTCKE